MITWAIDVELAVIASVAFIVVSCVCVGVAAYLPVDGNDDDG
jgi:hypothetical protein